jgi:hypothetical protein
MTAVRRMELTDLIAALDRAGVVVGDLVDRLDRHGEHDIAAAFALDAIADAANFLFASLYAGD